jgi:hypothetical protein
VRQLNKRFLPKFSFTFSILAGGLRTKQTGKSEANGIERFWGGIMRGSQSGHRRKDHETGTEGMVCCGMLSEHAGLVRIECRFSEHGRKEERFKIWPICAYLRAV